MEIGQLDAADPPFRNRSNQEIIEITFSLGTKTRTLSNFRKQLRDNRMERGYHAKGVRGLRDALRDSRKRHGTAAVLELDEELDAFKR